MRLKYGLISAASGLLDTDCHYHDDDDDDDITNFILTAIALAGNRF